MFSWFGRKSAPEPYRPFAPAWLAAGDEEGFARSVEGMTALVKSTATMAIFVAGSWQLGELRGAMLVIAGEQVVGARSAAIASPSGGATVDAEARSAISSVLQALRQHGLIAE